MKSHKLTGIGTRCRNLDKSFKVNDLWESWPIAVSCHLLCIFKVVPVRCTSSFMGFMDKLRVPNAG